MTHDDDLESAPVDGDLDSAPAVDHEHDAEGNDIPRPVASAEEGALSAADPGPDLEPGDASLLALVDRLGSLLDRSELSELAVQAGGTRLVLRKPAAIATAMINPVGADPTAAGATLPSGPTGASGFGPPTGGGHTDAPARPSVKAPLTGVWYSSPAPGSAAFTAVGREVAVGQVIGLIEAMKLFNEIKSDLAGRVVRVVPESGALVKAKQPLIEVEPL